MIEDVGAEVLLDDAALAEAILATAPMIVLVLDHDGCVTYINRYMEQLSGRDLGEARGCDWFELFVPPDAREQLRAQLAGCRTAPGEQPMVAPIVTATGERLLIEWRVRALDHRRASLLAVGLDITAVETEQRNLTEQLEQRVDERTQSLAEQREHLRRVLDSMGVMVVLVAPSGAVLQANRSARDVLDFVLWPTEATDGAHLPICSPESRAAFRHARAGHSTRYDLEAQRADGGQVVFDVTLSPVLDDHGSVRELVASAIDVTEARDNERRLRESLEALAVEQARQRWVETELRTSLIEKDALLQEVHHRVKNNLQVVASLLYLSGTMATDEVREVLDECRVRIRSMVLIHEQLYLSGTLSKIDMHEFLTLLSGELVHVFARQHGPKIRVLGGGLSVEIERAVPLALAANELLINALKYAYPVGFTADAEVRVEVNPDSLVVADDGVGLPEGAELASGRGTLGLRLVRALAAQVGGELEFTRVRGTHVRLRFS